MQLLLLTFCKPMLGMLNNLALKTTAIQRDNLKRAQGVIAAC